MRFEERYGKLNREQKKAVDHTEGPLLVVAGPGSGKTELLGIRAGRILQKTDTPPESVLCLTYTDAASSNMKERLIDLLGEDGHKIPTHTFHGLCKGIMESYPEYFFKGAFFDVADDATKSGILEQILKKLNHDNPLGAFHPQKGYIHLDGIKEAITQIKESGLKAREFEKLILENKKFLIETEEDFDEVFSKRISSETGEQIKHLLEKLKKRKDKSFFGHAKSLSDVVINSLELALEKGETRELSEWKRKWTKKDEEGKRVLKDRFAIERMEKLGEIYKEYTEKMYSEGYYEFLDMLLDVATKMEESESLRSELQEKYLYFMVDEFQDTSGIQMRILNLLTEDREDNRPNICVVGDDDQAIYRFQGAEISNILDFKDRYPTTKVITLLKNYRSTQKIIDRARKVIVKGERRLENVLDEVSKDLKSQSGKGEEVLLCTFDTKEEEYSFVARKIKQMIDSGKNPEEIAVVGRTHKILKEIEPFFGSLDVPIYSERKDNILEKDHVRQIITLIKFAYFFLRKEREDAEEIFPEILSFSFWGIKREKIFEIATRAYMERKSWFSVARKDKEVFFVTDFLLYLSRMAKNKSLEEVVDIAIGRETDKPKSPFKEHYFPKKKLLDRKSEYLDLLSSLRCFIEAVRRYKAGSYTKVGDMIEFLDIHEKNGIPIINKDPLVVQDGAVSLITAHGTKGREFETVFVLNCQKEEWGSSRRGAKMTLPANLPSKKVGEEDDDRLRLFYVTLTRAKTSLQLVSYTNKEDGREVTPLPYLSGIKEKRLKQEVNPEDIKASYFSPQRAPLRRKERDFLFMLVKKYKLSVTGLNKFLNVTDGGPQGFLEENLLRFPRKKMPPLSYGTAVHGVIKEIYALLKKEGKLPREKKVMELFESYLKKERLSRRDFEKYLKKGREELSFFYREKKDSFSPEHIVEKNFEKEDCALDGVEMTGKIDKIVRAEDGLEVADFKTGEPISDWEKGSQHEKINAWKYKNQLIFYKILVENSREFRGGDSVKRGFLEFLKPSKSGKPISLYLEIEEEEEKRLKELIKIVGKKVKNMDFPDVRDYKKKTVKEIRRFENDLLEKKK